MITTMNNRELIVSITKRGLKYETNIKELSANYS